MDLLREILPHNFVAFVARVRLKIVRETGYISGRLIFQLYLVVSASFIDHIYVNVFVLDDFILDCNNITMLTVFFNLLLHIWILRKYFSYQKLLRK